MFIMILVCSSLFSSKVNYLLSSVFNLCYICRTVMYVELYIYYLIILRYSYRYMYHQVDR